MSNISKLMSNSRTTEIFSAAQRMILEFDSGEWSEDAKLTSIFTELKPLNTKLERAINFQKAVSDLEDKDEIRDDKVRAIYYTLTGYLHNPDAALKAAALKVDTVFEHYGLKIIDDSYSTESGFIKSLLNDFTDTDLQPSITAMPGLSQLITELDTAQSNFEHARLAYEKEAAIEKNEDNATVVKKAVADIINKKLVVYLRAMVTFDEAKYGDITMTVAKIIDDNNMEVKKRRKKPVVEETTA